ncbi:MAG: ABC transporter [Sulfobacillus benefaciens]|uniref:ABC transporter n=1 Tax=Sulfobacillus benefaciens TaxID=453960 RepID=A0A2T2WTC3_9FIRM|nr:MAG: ABC transporter [Sulfobacillus benefaciens]
MIVPSQLKRTIAIFRLALSYWRDYRIIQRIQRQMSPKEAEQAAEKVYRRGGMRFREEALRLQGLIVKVGQFLSARTDVLPLAFTRELQQLQDQVPPAPFPEIRDEIEMAFGRKLSEVFDEFEPEPIAAASLGQVHKARLTAKHDLVAVKVRRPHIEELAKTDLKALGRIMKILRRWTKVGQRIDTVQLFEEFRESVYRELDYVQEQAHLLRFRRNFAEWKTVKVPDVYEDYVHPNVLVMEYVDGIKLTDVDELRRLELNPHELASTLVEAYLKQIVVDGFVQIDPHPGNFFAGRDGLLVFLDFGMISDIPSEHIEVFGRLVEQALARNAAGVVNAMVDLGFVRPSANLEILTRAMDVMLKQMTGVPLQEGPALSGLVRDFQDFLYEEPLQFPAQYMFLGRAIGMLFGLVSNLDPDLDWMTLLKDKALPMINERRVLWDNRYYQWVRAQVEQLFGPAGKLVWDRGAEKVALWGQIGLRLPESLDKALTRVGSGSIQTRPELTSVFRRLDRLSAQLSVAVLLVTAGLMAILAAMWQGHRPVYWLPLGFYLVSSVLAIVALFKAATLQRRFSRRRRH